MAEGALVAEPLQMQGKFEVNRHVRIPTDDPDVTLAADLFLPIGRGSVPALVMLFPYRRDLIGENLGQFFGWFAARGYACLLVDLRGTGSSDGVRRRIADADEGADGVAAIEWAASQPWSTGRVGMWGSSYGCVTTLRTATMQPSSLNAIIASEGPLDLGREAFSIDGARTDLMQRVMWGGAMLAAQLLPPLLSHGARDEQQRWRKRLHETDPVVMDLTPGPGREGWPDRVIDATSIGVPTFCVGGWRDLYCDATARTYAHIAAPKKLLMGPWGHVLPHQARLEPVDFPSIALRWWDFWLRGIDNGIMDEPPVTLYVEGAMPGWRSYVYWPSETRLRFATGADTTLVSALPDIAPTGVIADYEPDATIGTLSGLIGLGRGEYGGSLDQHEDDMRSASATSEPMLDDLIVAGHPEVLVRLAGEGSTVRRLVVRLSDVDPQARSTSISIGVVCPDGQSRQHRIWLSPSAYRVPAGNRLRVSVSDADFPRLLPLPKPIPFAIARIELHIPTVGEDQGEPVDVPSVDPSTDAIPVAGVEQPASWTITRDPINDGIEVAIGSRTPPLRTSQGHLIEQYAEARARVRRMAPDAAVTVGTSTVVARMRAGETITASATIRCTQTALWARGEVTIDDLTYFSRIWEGPLEHDA